MVCHGSTRTLNGLLHTAIEHGPSGKKSNSQTAHSHYLSLKKYVQRSFHVAYWNYINELTNLINSRLLKECCDACAPILQLIFQRSLESGTIPNDWHNANVTPLFKKGEHYKTANYRPVSLTSICSKLMEHVIASQIMGHLNTNNILYDLQHGFWDKCSC